MAKMQSVSMQVNNPGRSAQEDLNLTVGGTIVLTPQEVAKLVPGQLFRVQDHRHGRRYVFRRCGAHG